MPLLNLSGNALTEARKHIDSLPAFLDAVQKLPAMLREMPPAPVLVGAVSRVIAGALGAELRRRGPSDDFTDLCAANAIGEEAKHALFAAVVADIEAIK